MGIDTERQKVADLLNAAAQANKKRFRSELVIAYRELFSTDPDYAFAAARMTPEALAEKMIAGLVDGSANHDGSGIKRACKAVGIKHTRTAIRAYLAEA